MSLGLYYHPSAVKDAQQITEEYERKSEDLADEFWAELTFALEAIEKHPERHHFDLTGKRRNNLNKFPFHILFEERLDGIKILVIKHHRRNPSYGTRRK
jgi:hypothetical protein